MGKGLPEIFDPMDASGATAASESTAATEAIAAASLEESQRQFDIGQDKAKLEFDEAQRRHKEELQDAETSAKIATGEEVVSGGAVTKTKEAFAGWGIKGDASSGAVKTATKLNIQPLDRSDPNYEVRMSAGTPYFAMSNGRFMNKQGNFLD